MTMVGTVILLPKAALNVFCGSPGVILRSIALPPDQVFKVITEETPVEEGVHSVLVVIRNDWGWVTLSVRVSRELGVSVPRV